MPDFQLLDPLHDDSVARFRAVPEGYDPTDRARVFSYLQERQSAGEIVTGLLYPWRTTCLLRAEDGDWKLVHQHVSFGVPNEDVAVFKEATGAPSPGDRPGTTVFRDVAGRDPVH